MLLGGLLICVLARSSSPAEDASRSFVGRGSELPAFELRMLEGGVFSSNSLVGKASIVVFLRADQPESLAVLRELKKLEMDLAGVSWSTVAILSGRVTLEEARKLAKEASFSGTMLLDADRSAYSKFGVVAVPSLAVSDAKSRVVYSRPGLGKDLGPQVAESLRTALGVPPAEKRAQDGPRRSAPKLGLARGLMEEGKLEAAEKMLREAVAEEASIEGYLELGEVLLRRKEPEKALAVFRQAKEKYPGTRRFDVGAGRALAAGGQYQEAERALVDAILHDPGSWEAHVALGEVYEKLGKADLALREYKSAIGILRRAGASVR